MTTTESTTAAAESFVSHLVVATTALAAGVLTGGWIAFETGSWRSFKAFIEGLGGTVLLLVVGLLTVSVGITVLATYGRASRA